MDQLETMYAQFGAKLDAMITSTDVRLDILDPKIDAQDLKFVQLLWAIGIGTDCINRRVQLIQLIRLSI